MKKIYCLIFAVLVCPALLEGVARASCSATTDTWVPNAGTTAWNNTNNWSPNRIPGSGNTDNAYIRSDWTIPLYPNNNYTLGCLEINSGSMNAPTSTVTTYTLTMNGDYFRNLNPGSLNINTNALFTINMAGTAAQTFENVDPINFLTINNSTSVEFTQGFVIRNALTINAGSGTVYIDKTVSLQNAASALTIPSSATVEVKSGAVLVALGGITVNGVLKIDAGGKVQIGNGKTLQVGATGLLKLAGASGNIAALDADQGGSTYNLTVAGAVNADNFTISRTTATGMNVTGSIQTLSNGDFHYIAGSGYAITLGAAANPVTTWNTIGFFDDNGTGTAKNINASAYTGSTVTIKNWSGIGGAAYANDPSSKLIWGSQAPVDMQVTNATASGNPPATIAKGSAATLFASFGFSLTGTPSTAPLSTDVTSITFTIAGTNTASDINYIQVFDDPGTCTYTAGVNNQIGSNIVPTGTPPTATISIPAGKLTLSNTTRKCIHVLLATNSTAQTNDTLAIEINATADVSNSNNFVFSNSGGPPVTAGTSTITGAAIDKWDGGNSTPPSGNWSQANDWSTGAVPTNATDCQVGNGYTYPILNSASQGCQNITLPSGGTMSWNNTANILNVYGAMTVGSSYTFLNAASGIINFAGSTNQSIDFLTTWPGNVTVNSTGGTVTVNNNWTISGALTLTSGTFSVASGYTLTVGGNVNINGGTFILNPGSKLVLGNGSVVTVAAAGTLQMVGNAAQNATMTTASTANAFTVAINGTLKAQYYSFHNLGVSGVTVNAGATIDPTYYMQNGSFSYPVPNNAVLLTLNRQIPGNALSSMTFDAGGSAATGVMSVATNAAAGNLTISNYSGSLTGATYTNAPVYTVTWTSPTNTLNLTQQATGPASVNQGQIYTMGYFAFQQTQAGAFSNTDLTSIKITMTGTATASDVTSASLYYDSGCTGSTTTLLGSASFSGNPATAAFSGLTGATVDSSGTSPPKRCIVVQYSISSSATSGATVGAEIASSTDVSNTQNYAFNGSSAPPVNLGNPATIIGSTTTWTGATNTNWYTASNWNAGVPTSALNCNINAATNNPVIGAGTAVCKTLTNGNGTITMTAGSGAILQIFGDFTNTGTFTQNGQSLVIQDNGATATNQTLQSSSTLDALNFAKTAGGAVYIGNNSLTIGNAAAAPNNTFTIPAAQTFTFEVRNGDTLTLANGATLSSATFQNDGGGTIQTTAGKTITVSGGTFKANGTNDGYPQATSNKALYTVNGAGTWTFTSTSGTLNLTGFIISNIDTNGLNVGGTTSVTNLNGGQFQNLSNTYASVKAIQFNTTGTLPGTASYIGWNWGPNNTPPSPSTTYYLATSTGCANQTVNFDQWFGDFFVNVLQPDTTTKVSAVSCTINITAAASPVILTQFSATPYNGAVVLNWTTGLEWLHQGFNVYRSLSADSGFVQINPSLIRNPIANGTVHGTYQFYDTSVVNGVNYYYEIEDWATNGTRTMHGPLSATPLATLATAPPANSNATVANNQMPAPGPSATPQAPTPAQVFAAGQELLAPGVTLIAKTDHTLRLEFDVPAFTTSPATENPSYLRINMPGYSLSTQAGLPELPQRIVMVEIPPALTASATIVSQTHSLLSNMNIAPADAWVQSNGALVPSWTLNSQFYATDQMLPATPIALDKITQSQGISYLPILINPLSFDPVQKTVDSTTQVIVDIALDGAPAWNLGTTAPVANPWAQEAALKIFVKSAGLYQLGYADFVAAGVDAAFAGVDTTKMRMFLGGTEIPLQISSATGSFSPGDSITFFSPYFDLYDSDRNALILINDAVAGLRMALVNGAPQGIPASPEMSFNKEIRVEQNHFGFFNEPYSENLDHVFWGTFYAPPVNPGDDLLKSDVNLPNLIQSGTVTLQAFLKGDGQGAQSQNGPHHLRLFVNSSSLSAGDVVFATNDPYVATFKVPASYFNPGLNRVEFQEVGDLMPGDTDIVSLDYFTMDYPHAWSADSDSADASTHYTGDVLSVGGFTGTDLVAYDISDFSQTAVVSNGLIGPDGAGGNQISFASADRRYWVTRQSMIPRPYSIVLNPGSNLQNPALGAEAIYIGPQELLDAVAPLAHFRNEQGYSTKLISIEDIYSEFGRGTRGSDVLKGFIQYAANQWPTPKLKYVVLVGDGTYDPKGVLGFGTTGTLPIHLLKGLYLDYASDNWFVSWNANDRLPGLAIGRIPGNSPALVSTYVNKVIAYENGQLRPQGNSAGQFSIVADIDQIGGEKFAQRATVLSQQIPGWNPSLHVQEILRSGLTDAQLKSAIVNAFNSGSVFVHYLGHGAEDRWAGGSVFVNADADALANATLPIVVSMDCLNAYFYDADPGYQSLSDRLLFNPNGGAIAVWASPSMTNPNVQTPFQTAFYQTIANNPGIRLGEAIRLTKIQVGWSQGTDEVISSWTLLGDPMISVQIPAAPAPASSSNNSGGVGCGSISTGGSGGPGGGLGAALEFALLLVGFAATRRVAKKV